VDNPDLNESAWRRATAMAAGVYPTTTFQVAAALISIIFGSIAAAAASEANTTTQVACPVLGGATGLLMAFAVVFGAQLIAAPIRQRDELRLAQQAPKAETVSVDLTLRNAHRKGNELAKTLERSQGTTTSERYNAEQWTDEVVALMAGKAPDTATRDFLTAGQAETDPVRRLRMHVDALQRIIVEFGVELPQLRATSTT
jgi:hypothetical protein